MATVRSIYETADGIARRTVHEHYAGADLMITAAARWYVGDEDRRGVTRLRSVGKRSQLVFAAWDAWEERREALRAAYDPLEVPYSGDSCA